MCTYDSTLPSERKRNHFCWSYICLYLNVACIFVCAFVYACMSSHEWHFLLHIQTHHKKPSQHITSVAFVCIWTVCTWCIDQLYDTKCVIYNVGWHEVHSSTCIQTYIHTYISTCIYTNVHTLIHTVIHEHILECQHKCTRVYSWIHWYACEFILSTNTHSCTY